jgi:asparagine synthase (glutamine-hydrolysing)
MGLSASSDHRDREPFGVVSAIYASCGSPDPVQKSQFADLHVYLPNDVLVKVDRMSMSHGLEVRSPLLDHRVIEFAFRLPRTTKLKGLEAKHVLRTLARRRLPAELLRVPKHGFTAPVDRWIRENAAALQHDVLAPNAIVADLVDVSIARRWLDDHIAGRANRSYPLWALWMIHKWWENCRPPAPAAQAMAGRFAGVDAATSAPQPAD